MKRLEESKRIEARLAWFLVWVAVIIFLFALMWGMLNPHFYTLRETANQSTPPSQAAETGFERVSIVWEYAPLWVAMALLYGGYRRALNESKRNPGG